MYVSSGTDTLKTKIDSKQNTLTFGKLLGNSLKLEADIVGNDILVVGSSNIIGKRYNELKPLLNLNLVDNTSDVNKVVSTATQSALNLKAN